MTEDASSSGHLSQGGLDLRLDRNGAFAREISLDGEELFRGIGFVVRDVNWGTADLPAEARLQRQEGRVTATAGGALDRSAGDLTWSVAWTVTDRMVEARARASSASGFDTNRTGFVVLHSLGAARGRPVAVTHSDGRVEETRFPELVSPHQPFFDIAAMEYETAAGHRLRLAFEGEVFETEDQRNWTDASYKTYCRPLARPYPYRIEPSSTVEQLVRLEILSRATAAPHAPGDGPAVRKTAPFPVLGTSLPPGPVTLTQADAIRALGLGFTAIEIDPSEPSWLEEARAKVAAAAGPLRIDIRGAAVGTRAILEALAPTLVDRPAIGVSLWDADDAAVAAAREILPGTVIGAGTGAFFTELNRTTRWPAADYLAWTSNPTVHGSDDDTIGETTEPLEEILASAKAKLPVRRLQIGPMTLGLRYNPNATSPEGRRRSAAPDPRQGQVIAAAWVAGTVAGFLDPDVETLAFFEPSGPKGLIADDGAWTPAGHLLSRLSRCCAGRPASVLRWTGHPRLCGLQIEMNDHDALCIAHLRNERVAVALPEGIWRSAEELTPTGFVDRPVDGFDIGPFAVCWLLRPR